MDPQAPAHGTPRWVKVFAAVALVLLVVALIALLTGKHGPGRHAFAGPIVLANDAYAQPS